MLNWDDEALCLAKVQAFADYVGFRHTAKLTEYLATTSEPSGFIAAFRSLFGSLQEQ